MKTQESGGWLETGAETARPARRRKFRHYKRKERAPKDPSAPLPPPKKSAKAKIMDILARRDHSEQELKQKLGRVYPPEQVTEAIEFARENGWMISPEELAQRVAKELGRKRKGHKYVNQYLKQKGLPPVSKDLDDEFEEACELVEARLKKQGPFTFEEKNKIRRLLMSRGFDYETIRKVTNEKS